VGNKLFAFDWSSSRNHSGTFTRHKKFVASKVATTVLGIPRSTRAAVYNAIQDDW